MLSKYLETHVEQLRYHPVALCVVSTNGTVTACMMIVKRRLASQDLTNLTVIVDDGRSMNESVNIVNIFNPLVFSVGSH